MYSKLKETLGFTDVFFISLGYIIGAGIYSLIYLVTTYGRTYTWLSFIIGGIISLFTALSYSDLSTHFDTTASDYDYITQGLTSKFKFSTSSLLVGIGIITCSTLCLAFTNIVQRIFKNINYNIILLLVIIIPTLINIYDVKTTSNINMGISITETSTLVILILLCFSQFLKQPSSPGISTILKQSGGSLWNISDFNLKGIFHGGFMSVFAYSGFETIPKLADETKNSKKNIPLAMISSLVITMIIYTLVSISINYILGVDNVIKTVNPITGAFDKILGAKSKGVVNAITLLSIFNTILLTVLFTSRQLYGVAERQIYPKIFTKINSKTQTPIYAIIFVSLATLLVCLIKNIKITSHISNILLFVLFTAINLSAISLAFQGKMATHGIDFNGKNGKKKKGNIPIYSVLGLLSSLIVCYHTIRDLI